MNYDQFIQSQILFHERVLADIRAGTVSWCEECECLVPVEEMRANPWGGDCPMCIDCIADQGLDDNVLDPAETEEEKQQLTANPEDD
jgi:hypothetical protein